MLKRAISFTPFVPWSHHILFLLFLSSHIPTSIPRVGYTTIWMSRKANHATVVSSSSFGIPLTVVFSEFSNTTALRPRMFLYLIRFSQGRSFWSVSTTDCFLLFRESLLLHVASLLEKRFLGWRYISIYVCCTWIYRPAYVLESSNPRQVVPQAVLQISVSCL